MIFNKFKNWCNWWYGLFKKPPADISEQLTISFLTGSWKNEFMFNGKMESEVCNIDVDGKYYIEGEHWFNIVDFEHDSKNNTISFIKQAVKPGDERKFYNTVAIVDPDYLVNSTEHDVNSDAYSVCYKRI